MPVIPTKEEIFQAFLEQARQAVPDWLTADPATAWKLRYPDAEAPRWLGGCWLAVQREEAARRTIKTAARLSIALESEGDRAACRQRLLGLEGTAEGSDEHLLAYLRPLRPGQWRLVLAEIAEVLPQTNFAGYLAIAREAARLGWPTRYRADLTETDLGLLCSPGAPRVFWWGVRATGTDLFRPNDLMAVRWALAQLSDTLSGTERRYYACTGKALKAIAGEQLVAQLVRSPDPTSFEQALHDAEDAEYRAEQVRPRNREAVIAHEDARGAAQRARDELTEVKKLRHRYT